MSILPAPGSTGTVAKLLHGPMGPAVRDLDNAGVFARELGQMLDAGGYGGTRTQIARFIEDDLRSIEQSVSAAQPGLDAARGRFVDLGKLPRSVEARATDLRGVAADFTRLPRVELPGVRDHGSATAKALAGRIEEARSQVTSAARLQARDRLVIGGAIAGTALIATGAAINGSRG